MPAPINVELHDHDPSWLEDARLEASRLMAVLGGAIEGVHHIGSTAIPGIKAKPILDLMPVTISLAALDTCRSKFEGLGYVWWGEYGLPGPRYCTLDDPETGRRLIQLHCYEQNSADIIRHLAFRDYLKAISALAREYELEKLRCRELYPADSHAYSDWKSAWVGLVEAQAVAWWKREGISAPP
jgi:GrpB-like predicted nucleotidyltransferase (UPF0157 family)